MDKIGCKISILSATIKGIIFARMPKQLSLRLPLQDASQDKTIKLHVAAALKIKSESVNAIQILRRSIDARGRNIFIQLQLNIFVNEPFVDAFSFYPKLENVSNKKEIFIAGCGPAGLFAALKLIERGYKPVILERGKDVRNRRRDLAAMNKHGIVNPESNYCFGEGGAGTYSDGKLYTRATKRGNVLQCLQWFRYFGAEENILYEAHPHIGTNKLPGIITKMREAIEDCGGMILFDSKLTDIEIKDSQICSVEINHHQKIPCDTLILATGHSARDIFELLEDKKVKIDPKPFALGVRVEHPQNLIDSIQYHCDIQSGRDKFLPAASYSLVAQENGKGVFSFCMCPGGIIAPASTAEGELVVNGWSPSKRDNPYANSGMVVTVDESIFSKYGFKGNLAAMHFQQMVEQQSWKYGGGKLVAPAQRMTDFVKKKLSPTLPDCSYLPGVNSSLLNEALPTEIFAALANGFKTFGQKMKGYFTEEAILVATESRTSSPIRIPRHEKTLQHVQIKGLYPCGEGAGYAGGIISAAIDGERVAAMIDGVE